MMDKVEQGSDDRIFDLLKSENSLKLPDKASPFLKQKSIFRIGFLRCRHLMKKSVNQFSHERRNRKNCPFR